MKTPMQEMIEFMKEKLKEDTLHYNTHPSNGGLIAIRMSQFYLEIAESMLEKEKEVMCEFQSIGQNRDFWVNYYDNEQCFDQTFNTKKK
jgi:uncharacterized protein (DUF608 family)